MGKNFNCQLVATAMGDYLLCSFAKQVGVRHESDSDSSCVVDRSQERRPQLDQLKLFYWEG